jgi:hypothetical protein
MSTITFHSATTTRPALVRRDRIQRSTYSINSTNEVGNPHIGATTTEAEEKKHRRRRRNHKHKSLRQQNRSSIHLSIPHVPERDSSLYSQPLAVLRLHDWSKSCSDLTKRTITEFPFAANKRSSLCTGVNLNQPSSILGASIDTSTTLEWCYSTLQLSNITHTPEFELEKYIQEGYSGSESESSEKHSLAYGINISQSTRCPSSVTGTSQYTTLYQHPSISFIEPVHPSKASKWTRLGKVGRKLRVSSVSHLVLTFTIH